MLEKDIEQGFAPYTPVRYIFISSIDCDYCSHLLDMCTEAHRRANIPIWEEKYDNGIRKIIFDNDDEAWYWPYEITNSEQMAPADVKNYSIKLFFDDKLPKDAVWDVIDTLGLKNYTVSLGICDERSYK